MLGEGADAGRQGWMGWELPKGSEHGLPLGSPTDVGS